MEFSAFYPKAERTLGETPSRIICQSPEAYCYGFDRKRSELISAIERLYDFMRVDFEEKSLFDQLSESSQLF